MSLIRYLFLSLSLSVQLLKDPLIFSHANSHQYPLLADWLSDDSSNLS